MVRVCVKQDKRIIDMNYALIIAGGSGNRMGQDIPKQFMHVDNCPIIIHTMMAFQKHPDIQGIAVVCLAGWETVLLAGYYLFQHRHLPEVWLCDYGHQVS